MKKRIISLALAIITLLGILVIPASAANYTTNYSAYDQPESNDYAYWNGRRVVRGSGTTTSEIRWIQAVMNFVIQQRGLNAPYADVDGSFGPGSTKTCRAIQKALGLQQDGSCGPATIAALKSALSTSGSGGNVSYNKVNYQQYDSRWGNLKYGGRTMTNSGCGILAIVNAVANLPGTTVNTGSTSPTTAVKQVAQWGYDIGDFNRYDGGCYSRIVEKAAKKFGSTYGFKCVGSGSSAYDQKLLNHLANGGTAVAHVYQHYICLAGYSNGKILVIDPAANCGRRTGLTSKGTNCWKTPYELTYGSYAIKVDNYWLFSKA